MSNGWNPDASSRGADLDQAEGVPRDAALEIRRLWLAGAVEEARLELVQATQSSLFRFLRAMLHDDETASDLFQETYLKAFQALGSFRGEATPTTWVLSIGRNVALNRLRRGRLESRWRVEMDELPDVADGRTDALDQLPEPRLRAGVASLPVPQREAVILFYLEDLSVEEVAQLTGRPANTIKSDLRRARLALQATLTRPVAESGHPGADR